MGYLTLHYTWFPHKLMKRSVGFYLWPSLCSSVFCWMTQAGSRAIHFPSWKKWWSCSSTSIGWKWTCLAPGYPQRWSWACGRRTPPGYGCAPASSWQARASGPGLPAFSGLGQTYFCANHLLVRLKGAGLIGWTHLRIWNSDGHGLCFSCSGWSRLLAR